MKAAAADRTASKSLTGSPGITGSRWTSCCTTTILHFAKPSNQSAGKYLTRKISFYLTCLLFPDVQILDIIHMVLHLRVFNTCQLQLWRRLHILMINAL